MFIRECDRTPCYSWLEQDMNYITPRWKIGILAIAKCCACAILAFILCARIRYILIAHPVPQPLTLLQLLVTAVACIAVSATLLTARSKDVILILFTAAITAGGALLGVVCFDSDTFRSIPIRPRKWGIRQGGACQRNHWSMCRSNRGEQCQSVDTNAIFRSCKWALKQLQ